MIVTDLNKNYGKEYGRNGIVAVTASDIVSPPRFTTGSLSLDVILGGGWPGNRWSEVRGEKSAGKTSLMFKSIAANQRINPNFHAVWVAAEDYDTNQSASLGVDNSRVTVITTKQMEFAFQAMLDVTNSGEVDMVILDSYAALTPDEEAEKAMDEFTTAAGARNMNKFTRKAGLASNRATDGSERPFTGIIINQYRQKYGARSSIPGYVPMTTPGGEGKDYFYNVILKLKRTGWIDVKRLSDSVTVGQNIKFSTDKNKTAAPNQAVELDFYFRNAPEKGFKRGEFDIAKDYATMAFLFGVINKKGAWYHFNGDKWHGKEEVFQALREDLGLRDEIADLVLSAASTDPDITDSLIEVDRAEE